VEHERLQTEFKSDVNKAHESITKNYDDFVHSLRQEIESKNQSLELERNRSREIQQLGAQRIKEYETKMEELHQKYVELQKKYDSIQ